MGYSRFVPTRYFSWAPYDEISLYELEVQIDGRMLTRREIRRRYDVRSPGRENRSIQHVVDIVRQYEETYGMSDEARVVLRYRTNGGEPRAWRWP